MKPVILIAATMAGLGGFGWTLFSYSAPAGALGPRDQWPEYQQSPNRVEFAPRVDPAERIRQLKAILVEHPENADAWYRLGMVQQLTGDQSAATASWAKAADAQAAARPPQPDSGFLYDLACYRALAGDREGALEAWTASVGAGWADRDHAESDTDLDSIRSDPRFLESFNKLSRIPRRTVRLNAG